MPSPSPSPRPCLVYLCNALDEKTRLERSITSDSPAATQKVLQIALALRSSGVTTTILSLGRGRQRGSGRWHPAKIVRTQGVAIVYAPYFDFPWLTHLVTCLAVPCLIWRLSVRKPVLLAYNRLPHYVLGIEFARVLGLRRFLDLEDGNVRDEGTVIRQWIARAMTKRFDDLCDAGSLLAASSLSTQYAGSNTLPCYGVAESSQTVRDWSANPLKILLGGTLQRTTGAELFVAAIRYLRQSNLKGLDLLELNITGKGHSEALLKTVANEAGLPLVHFHGSVPRTEYLSILTSSHIGLVLNLPSSQLGGTTFPSKAINMAAAGLAIVSTKVSDVPTIFQSKGAIYLEDENPQTLAKLLLELLEQRQLLAATAQQGQHRVAEICSQAKVGQSLKTYFFN
jgi:glycosyltransferase involved in cell wall biosynthesis